MPPGCNSQNDHPTHHFSPLTPILSQFSKDFVFAPHPQWDSEHFRHKNALSVNPINQLFLYHWTNMQDERNELEVEVVVCWTWLPLHEHRHKHTETHRNWFTLNLYLLSENFYYFHLVPTLHTKSPCFLCHPLRCSLICCWYVRRTRCHTFPLLLQSTLSCFPPPTDVSTSDYLSTAATITTHCDTIVCSLRTQYKEVRK